MSVHPELVEGLPRDTVNSLWSETQTAWSKGDLPGRRRISGQPLDRLGVNV